MLLEGRIVIGTLQSFLLDAQVQKKLGEMLGEGEVLSLEHEDHTLFLHQHDEQLLLWFNRSDHSICTPMNY